MLSALCFAFQQSSCPLFIGERIQPRRVLHHTRTLNLQPYLDGTIRQFVDRGTMCEVHVRAERGQRYELLSADEVLSSTFFS